MPSASVPAHSVVAHREHRRPPPPRRGPQRPVGRAVAPHGHGQPAAEHRACAVGRAPACTSPRAVRRAKQLHEGVLCRERRCRGRRSPGATGWRRCRRRQRWSAAARVSAPSSVLADGPPGGGVQAGDATVVRRVCVRVDARPSADDQIWCWRDRRRRHRARARPDRDYHRRLTRGPGAQQLPGGGHGSVPEGLRRRAGRP